MRLVLTVIRQLAFPLRLASAALVWCAIFTEVSGAQFGHETCRPYSASSIPSSPDEFKVVITGDQRDLIELWDGQRLLYAPYNETRDAMGGAGLNCRDDVRIAGSGSDVIMVAIRLGRENDLLHAYGFNRDRDGKIIAVQEIMWHPRDSSMGVYISGNYIGTRYLGGPAFIDIRLGRENDRKFRFCFNPPPPPAIATHLVDVFPPYGWSFSGGDGRARMEGFPACRGRVPPDMLRVIPTE